MRYYYLFLEILHLHMNYECCKIFKTSCSISCTHFKNKSSITFLGKLPNKNSIRNEANVSSNYFKIPLPETETATVER